MPLPITTIVGFRIPKISQELSHFADDLDGLYDEIHSLVGCDPRDDTALLPVIERAYPGALEEIAQLSAVYIESAEKKKPALFELPLTDNQEPPFVYPTTKTAAETIPSVSVESIYEDASLQGQSSADNEKDNESQIESLKSIWYVRCKYEGFYLYDCSK